MGGVKDRLVLRDDGLWVMVVIDWQQYQFLFCLPMRILTCAPLPWGAFPPLGWVGVALCAPFPLPAGWGPCRGLACGGAALAGGLGPLLGSRSACRLPPLPPFGLPLGVWGSSRFSTTNDVQRLSNPSLDWLKPYIS